ncbi:MAG: hypothetical protein ACK52H_15055 [Burkholderiales bacterium]|jgi:hypothetical protein
MTTPPNRFGPTRRTATALLLAGLLSGCITLPGRNACPQSEKAESLQGSWLAQLAGSDAVWTLRLAPHPEHKGSWRGELIQGDKRYAVVADLDDGEFTMEETHDGQRIAATWLGSRLAGDCTPTLQGHRIENDQTRQAFTLRPAP